MKASHTPGPWYVSHSGYANSPFVIFAGTVKPNFANKFPLSGVNAIAEIFHDESEQHEEQAGNARLIAAAPNLFRELDAIIDSATDGREIPEWLEERLVTAKAAIQKVHGGR